MHFTYIYVINLDLVFFPAVRFTLIRRSLSVPLGESVTDVLHINMLYVNLHACHLPCTPPPFNLDLHSPRFSVCFCDITLLLLFCVLFFSVTLSFSISRSPFGSCCCLCPVMPLLLSQGHQNCWFYHWVHTVKAVLASNDKYWCFPPCGLDLCAVSTNKKHMSGDKCNVIVVCSLWCVVFTYYLKKNQINLS